MMRDRLIDHASDPPGLRRQTGGRSTTGVCVVSGDQTASGGRQRTPAKHEVRFHQSRLVHDFIYQGVLSVLQQQLETPLPLDDEPQPAPRPLRKTAWRRGAISFAEPAAREPG